MEDLEIRQLKNTINELILNLMNRIDNFIEENNNSDKEILTSESVYFILEDISVLADGIGAIYTDDSVVNIEELREKISMLHQSMEDKDGLLFKDIMELELKQLLEAWSEEIV